MIEKEYVTYEITYPENLARERAVLMFSSLAGVFGHVEKWSIHGRPTIVAEVFADIVGIKHSLSFPSNLRHIIEGHLMATMPGVGLKEVGQPVGPWDHAVELATHPAVLVNDKPVPLDDASIPVLLTNLRQLGKNEKILIQWIFAPAGTNDIFRAVGRIAVSTPHEIRSLELLKGVLISYQGLQVFASRPLRGYALAKISNRSAPIERWPITTNPQDLPVFCAIPIGEMQIPGMVRGRGRHLLAEASIPSEGFRVGITSHPGQERHVALEPDSLKQHLWVMGGTGSGKSVLLHNIAAQMMEQDYGLVLIEPKGDLARDVLSSVPKDRVGDVIWFDPTETQRPIGLNVLGGPDADQTSSNVVGLFHSLYGDSWGPRLAYILKYAVMTAALNGLTLYDVKQLLINTSYRKKVLAKTTDRDVRQFWNGLEKGPDSQIDSVINKLDAFVGAKAIRNIVGQTTGLNLKDVVENKKILLVPLDSAKLGSSNASMFGSLLVSQLWQEVRLRRQRPTMFLMLDEFQNFLSLSVAMEDAFSQARSYGMGLVVANQNSQQLSTSVQAAVKANARSKAVFALSADEGRKMAPDFPPMDGLNLQGLNQYEAAMSIMTPGGAARTTTVMTYPQFKPTGAGPKAKALSASSYGRDVAEVEAEFKAKHGDGEPGPKAKIGQRND